MAKKDKGGGRSSSKSSSSSSSISKPTSNSTSNTGKGSTGSLSSGRGGVASAPDPVRVAHSVSGRGDFNANAWASTSDKSETIVSLSGRSVSTTGTTVPGVQVRNPPKSQTRNSKLSIQVTSSRQLERNGIASSTVSKTRTGRNEPVRGRASPPENRGDAKRRAERPKSDKSFKGYDALKGKPKTLSERLKKLVCKERPKDNKPKGSGGSGKRFVPWC